MKHCKYLCLILSLAMLLSVVSLASCGKINNEIETTDSGDMGTIDSSCETDKKDGNEKHESNTAEKNGEKEQGAGAAINAPLTLPNVLSLPKDDFESAQLRFALSLFKESVAMREDNSSALLSPLSVAMALLMLANGAEGEARTELETILGLETDTLNARMKAHTDSLLERNLATLRIANSIWLKDGAVTPDAEFEARVRDYLGAEIFNRPFDDATKEEINAWVKKYTDGMIDSIIEEIDSDAAAYLINALVFDGAWSSGYSEDMITKEKFYAYGGSIFKTDMLRSKEYRFLNDGKATGFIKGYNGDYSFVALLPNEGVDLYDYIAALDASTLYSLISNPAITKVNTGIPTFQYENKVKLNDTLRAMGLEYLFEGAAEVGGGEVLHKTAIELTPYGTKAAAVTNIMTEASVGDVVEELPEVVLDRPFLYLIVDSKSLLPIFMGTVTDIEGAEEIRRVEPYDTTAEICQTTRWLDLYYDEALLEPFTVAKDGRRVILKIDSEEELVLLTAAVYPENEDAVLFSLPDGFFHESVLILCYLEEGSGSIKHTLRGCDIVEEAGKRTLRMLADTYEPSVQTTDMAGWFIGVGIRRSDAEDCAAYSIEFRRHFLEEEEPEPIPGNGACVRIDFCGDEMELLSPMAEPTHLTDGRTIIRIDSMEELAAFTALLKENRFVLDFDEGVQSYNDLISQLDEAYFEEYSLIMAYVTENSGSIRHRLKDSMLHHNGKIGKDTVILVVERIEPTEQTEDMAGWLICNAISKRYTEVELYYEIQFK